MVYINVDDEIIKLLQSNLIKPKNGLKQTYDRIINYYKRSCEIEGSLSNDDKKDLDLILPRDLLNTDELTGEFSYIKHEKLRSIAIDFPISISNGQKGRKKIMICAMDSLPPNEGGFTNSIIPWAPFSLNYNWQLAKKTEKQNIAFFNVLLTKADLYVTDVYKLFFRRGALGTDLRSNRDKYYIAQQTHREILKEEIKTIEPAFILTLGNDARNAIYSIANMPLKNWENDVQEVVWEVAKGKDIEILSIPHISGSANGAKAKIQKNVKYNSIKETGNEKLARIVLERL